MNAKSILSNSIIIFVGKTYSPPLNDKKTHTHTRNNRSLSHRKTLLVPQAERMLWPEGQPSQPVVLLN
jgi:hypothetical protein